MFGGIQNGIPHLLQIGTLHQGPCRTAVDTLTAVGTDYLGHGKIFKGGDPLMVALVGNCKGIHSLQLLTGTNTALTTNAFTIVFLYGGREFVDGIIFNGVEIDKDVIPHRELVGEVLKFTLPVFITFGTVGIVLRKQQLDYMFSC
jgi:hypothetical protein